MRIAAAALIATLVACGSGGGGANGGTPTAVTYSGNTSQAVITNANASTLVAESVGGTDGGAATSSLAGADPAAREERMLHGRRLARIFRATLTERRADGSSMLTVPVDKTEACRNGGTRRLSGDLTVAATGTLTVTYTNCREDEDALTGEATMFIFHTMGRPGQPNVPLGFTVTFTRLALRGRVSADISGSVQVQVTESLDTETTTENIVALYNSTGRMTKSGNLVFIDTYDHAVLPTSYTRWVNGRVLDSVHGYFDIKTSTPLSFPTLTQAHPSSGVLVYTGAGLGNDRRIRVTALSATMVELALDFNGDGAYERAARLRWDALQDPIGEDVGDDDRDGMHNSWETAFGLNPAAADASADADGDGRSNLAEYRDGTNPAVRD